MHNYTSRIPRYFLAILFLTLTACSSIQPEQSSNIINNKIQQTRVVLVGETHTNYGHHLNQLDIIKKTHSRALARQRRNVVTPTRRANEMSKKWGGVILTIGLEMVQQPFQSYLDDYIAGNITELEMLRGVEWYSRWRYDFRLYRPIFDYAKQNNIPLIALNIPQEVTKRVSKVGIDGLTTKERKQLPTFIDRSNLEYTTRLRKTFGMHAHGKAKGKKFDHKGFDRFVDAQLAWDEGMAFAASNYLKKHPKKRMVILAGSGHLINREGIPSRIDRQLKLTGKKRSLVILSHSDTKYTSRESDISLPTKDIKLPPAGLIGIGMKDTQQGVKISTIVQSGAAKKAGLLKDDLLVKLNKVTVKTSSDVNLWRLDRKPNDKVEAQIRRGKKLLTKTLTLGGQSN